MAVARYRPINGLDELRAIGGAADRPELALIASVIRVALVDAREGDAEARRWLACPLGQAWLATLVEPDAFPAIHARLLALAGGSGVGKVVAGE